jgi:hypothetical protein
VSSRVSCFVAGCFVEVYNEVLRDLGSQDGREGMLDLREDPVTGKVGMMMPVCWIWLTLDQEQAPLKNK